MRVEISQRNLAVPAGIVWLAALAVGLVGVSQRLLTGHELSNYTSSIPWGCGWPPMSTSLACRQAPSCCRP